MNDIKMNAIKLYIVPLLVVVSIILLVPLVLMPQLDAIRDKNLEVKEKQKRLEVLTTKLQALDQIVEAEETGKLLEVEKVIPSDKQLASLVVGVRNLAASSDLAVAGMSLSPGRVATQATTPAASKRAKAQAAAKKDNQDDQLVFTLTLRGEELADFQEFFNNIEKAKRLLGIDTMEISRDEDGDHYLFDMEIEAPFKEIRSSGDAIATPLPEYSGFHQTLLDFVSDFINYTNIALQEVETGVPNPFD